MNTDKSKNTGKFEGKHADVTDKILQAFFKFTVCWAMAFRKKSTRIRSRWN
jgi:hypothetical protein